MKMKEVGKYLRVEGRMEATLALGFEPLPYNL